MSFTVEHGIGAAHSKTVRESRKAANNQDTVKEAAVEEPDPLLIPFPWRYF